MNESADRSEPEDAGVESPSIVDGFEDFVRVGTGGFSAVYSARQVRLGRAVAIKVIDADLGTDADRQMFERESQAMGVLSRHPNIATVYSEAYTTDGRPCLVMELYHGNYRDRLDKSGPLPLGEFLALGVKIAGALQAAHDLGILHRDIKPHNIFLSDFGEPALGDFGISTIEGERSITEEAALSVAYAAPEVLDDAAADFLSDLFPVAAGLHHLLVGSSPFAAPQIGSVIKRILTEEPDPIRRADVPDSLRSLLRSGLSKRPLDRPDSAGDLALSFQDVQAELGFDRTAIPLQRSERLDPDVGADWANSSGEASARRRAVLEARGEPSENHASSSLAAENAEDAEATIFPPGIDRPELPRDVAPERPAVPQPPARPAPTDVRTVTYPRPGIEPTIRRQSAACEAMQTAQDFTEVDPEPRARRGSWVVDLALAVSVVALVVFALFRMI